MPELAVPELVLSALVGVGAGGTGAGCELWYRSRGAELGCGVGGAGVGGAGVGGRSRGCWSRWCWIGGGVGEEQGLAARDSAARTSAAGSRSSPAPTFRGRGQPNDDSRSVACGDARHGRDVEGRVAGERLAVARATTSRIGSSDTQPARCTGSATPEMRSLAKTHVEDPFQRSVLLGIWSHAKCHFAGSALEPANHS